MIPAPPTPWKTLPIKSRVRFDATQQKMVPQKKKQRDAMRITGRPKMLLSSDRKGMVTALVSKYEVPIQMPSVVSRFRSRMMDLEN